MLALCWTSVFYAPVGHYKWCSLHVTSSLSSVKLRGSLLPVRPASYFGAQLHHHMNRSMLPLHQKPPLSTQHARKRSLPHTLFHRVHALSHSL
jgi:hypothetical protein